MRGKSFVGSYLTRVICHLLFAHCALFGFEHALRHFDPASVRVHSYVKKPKNSQHRKEFDRLKKLPIRVGSYQMRKNKLCFRLQAISQMTRGRNDRSVGVNVFDLCEIRQRITGDRLKMELDSRQLGEHDTLLEIAVLADQKSPGLGNPLGYQRRRHRGRARKVIRNVIFGQRDAFYRPRVLTADKFGKPIDPIPAHVEKPLLGILLPGDFDFAFHIAAHILHGEQIAEVLDSRIFFKCGKVDKRHTLF